MIKTSIEINKQLYSNSTSEFAFKTESRNTGYQWLKVQFTNNSDKTIKFNAFHFDIQAFDGVPGERIRIYKEGWTMTSAAASVRYGEKDFQADPDYLKFAVSEPDDYNWKDVNMFSAEHVIVLNDKDTNDSLLAGFISSANQITRFKIKLDANGLKTLTAISSGDGVEVDPGETICSEELVILEGNDGYALLEDFADLWAKRMKALTWDHVPTGWCSWYYYFSNVTENDIIENINYISENKDDFPIEYIQLDDGYQAALGDWLECNEKFPNGLKHLAEKVSDTGLKSGLWLAPFMVEKRSKLFKNHPEWMVKDEKDEILWASEWRGCPVAVLDGTHPGAQKYLYDTFTQLVNWGFEYVKLDFMSWACMGKGGYYHDRKATRAQALRCGLQAIRDAMGDKFILGCTTPLGQVVGLVNGERIGTDITPQWQPPPPRTIYTETPTVPNVCRNIINRSYMNGRLWISDPDTHIAREDNIKLTDNEIELWTYALYMVGGMMLLSDRFETLSPERAKLSKLLLKEPRIFETRPLDFFENEYPSIWLRRRKDFGEILLGLFNLDSEAKEMTVDLNKIEAGKTFLIEDFISSEKINYNSEHLTLKVNAHSCKILKITKGS